MHDPKGFYFQDVLDQLKIFWKSQGCVIREGYDLEVGAGTFNPDTFLRSLGNDAWATAYIESSRRPKDGRYGKNPNRLGFYYQFQVLIKPSPNNIIDLYLKSLEYIGIDLKTHDLRFVEDNWKSPTLGAWGLGWEVWLDGMEITQFTYFQQMAGIPLSSIPIEITYGTERLVMYLQEVDHFKDIQWNQDIKYGDLHLDSEQDYASYAFEIADPKIYFHWFESLETEFFRAIDKHAVFAAYDLVLKCSHIFNILDARGAISVTEREAYILRIRNMTTAVGKSWMNRKYSTHPI